MKGREPVLAQHVIQVVRIASATLRRAGLGRLRRAVIEGAQASTYLQTDIGLVLALTLPSGTSVADGLGELGLLWADQAHAARDDPVADRCVPIDKASGEAATR